MNDKEQIEEMARVMAGCEKTCDECFAEYEKLFTQPIQNRGNHCQAIEYCTKLYNAGYRNCKDKVVLTREEYEKLYEKGYDDGKQFAEKFYKPLVKAETRQETIREILQIIKREYDYIGNLERIIAEKYGVEVE